MSAFGLASKFDVLAVDSQIGRAVTRSTPPSIGHILELAELEDDCVARKLSSGRDNRPNEELPAALTSWLDLPLRRQREDLRAYVRGGGPAESERRFDLAHYRVSAGAFGTKPRAIQFRSGIEINLAFLRAELDANAAEGPSSSWRIVDLLQEIERANAALTLSLAEFGKRLRIGPDHLGRLFKGVTGIAFRSFLRKYRAVRTAELLTVTVWTLEEIAGLFGHSQSSHLVREFRSEIGVTPGQFRRFLPTASSAAAHVVR